MVCTNGKIITFTFVQLFEATKIIPNMNKTPFPDPLPPPPLTFSSLFHSPILYLMKYCSSPYKGPIREYRFWTSLSKAT